jgi:hypothetical protein
VRHITNVLTTPMDWPSGVSTAQLCVTNEDATNEWLLLCVVKSYTISGVISLILNIGTLTHLSFNRFVFKYPWTEYANHTCYTRWVSLRAAALTNNWSDGLFSRTTPVCIKSAINFCWIRIISSIQSPARSQSAFFAIRVMYGVRIHAHIFAYPRS